MRRAGVGAAAALVLALGLAACTGPDDPPAPPATASASPPPPPPSAGAGNGATAGIVAAATAFLGTLGDDQRDEVLFDRGDRAQQQRWSNLPDRFFERGGLRLGDLDAAQAEAFQALMRATLSDEGYARVMGGVAADDTLGGGFGRDLFRIAVIGEPSATEPWQWQFGGHHVTVNATVRGDTVSLTPSFLGAQPATFDSGGATVRPLGDLADRAFALVTSLSGDARQRAVLGGEPIDLVLGVGQDCRSVPPEGLPGAAMTAAQQRAFLALINGYGGLGRDSAARLAQLEEDLPRTSFAWYGPTTPGAAAYFRITGPRVFAEYSPQAMGGDPVNHIHGIYRDPVADYGGTVC